MDLRREEFRVDLREGIESIDFREVRNPYHKDSSTAHDICEICIPSLLSVELTQDTRHNKMPLAGTPNAISKSMQEHKSGINLKCPFLRRAIKRDAAHTSVK